MVLLISGASGATTDRDALRALPAGIDLQALKPHLINLADGRFSSGGQLRTTPEDISAIFGSHLPEFVAAHGGRDVPLMFWAHGGLVNETDGLTGAVAQIPWWLANGVYPIFFIWETGLFDAIGSLLGAPSRDIELGIPEERGFLQDAWNKAFELLARPVGPKIWGQMKLSAAQSVAEDGGALFVARALADFVSANPQAVQLHAAGHSAGSIFHSYFLPAYAGLEAGTGFTTLQLLAPAITVGDFKARLMPLLGAAHGVEQLSMFSMNAELEEDDNVIGVYKRSLLCLIRAALEVEPTTPILGLAESVAADSQLTGLFGTAQAGAIWSRTTSGPKSSRSDASSHGSFDNDANTMTSVVCRVLGREDVIDYAASRPLESPEKISSLASVPVPVFASAQQLRKGDRYALCVGINEFQNLPKGSWLNGCVNDANDFAALLGQGFGFANDQIEVLTDAAATKDAVMSRLGAAMERAENDGLKHIVFTFSSHGTQIPDTSGDETDQADEAFATYDLNQAGDQWDPATLISDDELHALFARSAPNLLLEVVLDTCHSGTGLKALDLLPGRRPRFLPPPTPIGLDLTATADHRAFRDLVSRTSRGTRPVLLAGCRSDQTSADAVFDGRYNGAFTYYLLEELRSDPARSRRALLGVVSKALTAGRFDQRAQLEGPVAAKSTPWGSSFVKLAG
ncbi:caspase family protein [Arthrobacter sp. MYb227]|uniref:caspase family protein n=1 Tax=Arthrobacter sp. MYb227 TaxID=1848601 RepID=UPI002157FF21|nr:caspase family protein [Arthrobacter sp. MYb227]